MSNKSNASCFVPNKIKISKDLLASAISLLEDLEIDMGEYPPETIQLYGYILYTFKQKKAIVDMRETYARLIDSDEFMSRLEMFRDHACLSCDGVPF